MRPLFANHLVSLLLLVSLLPIQSIASQQKLTNQDVIKMVRAGLSPEIVIQTINTSENNFDISPNALVALKHEGVSDSIIQAMLARSRTTGPKPHGTPGGVNDPNQSARGVTLIDGAKRITMKYSSPEQRSSRMFFGNPLSAKTLAALKGNRAELRITNPSPEFEVAIPYDANPSDFVVILKFDVKSDRREIQTQKVGIGGVKNGIPENRRLPIKTEETQSQNRESSGYYKFFRVRLIDPISSGEYAIVISGNVFSLYDFGVDASK